MPEPKLLHQVRQAARLKHFSLRTERSYVQWVYRFVVYHGRRHPRELGAREIRAFLSWLAVERNVAASTQNQALCALLFLYREVLGIDLPRIEEAVRARRSRRVPWGDKPPTRPPNRSFGTGHRPAGLWDRFWDTFPRKRGILVWEVR